MYTVASFPPFTFIVELSSETLKLAPVSAVIYILASPIIAASFPSPFFSDKSAGFTVILISLSEIFSNTPLISPVLSPVSHV